MRENRAPCHALRELPPEVVGVQGIRLRGERLTWTRKGEGDKSMSRLLAVGEKRGMAEDVYAMALQHLSDMVKARIA